MAITQKHKVTFTITTTVGSSFLKEIQGEAVRLSKAFMGGDALSPRQLHCLTTITSKGPEGFVDLITKSTVRDHIRGITDGSDDEVGIRVSPAAVRKVSQ